MPDRSPTWRRLGLGALVAAVVGLVTWFLWPTLTGGDPPPDEDDPPAGGVVSTAAPGELSPEQRDLLATVSVYAAGECRAPTSEPFPGQDVAISCAADDQAPTRAVFRRFTSNTALDAAFDRVAGGVDDGGDCRAGVDAAHPYEGRDVSGRVVCITTEIRTGLSWTVPDRRVLGSSRIDDPQARPRLYAWWDDLVERRVDDRLRDTCQPDESLEDRTSLDGDDIGAAAAVRCTPDGGVATSVSQAQYTDLETLRAWIDDNATRLDRARDYTVVELDDPQGCAGLGQGARRAVAGRTPWSGDGGRGELICFVNGAGSDPETGEDLNVLFWSDEHTLVGAVAVSRAPSPDVPAGQQTTLEQLISEWRTAPYRTAR